MKISLLILVSLVVSTLLAPSLRANVTELNSLADQIFKLFASSTTSEHDQQAENFPLGQPPIMRRPVFSKAHGCLKAQFVVDGNLPAELKVGVFASSSFPAWVRFSNDGAVGPDTVPIDKGGNPARGMAVKLVGVPGPKLLAGQETALTQDFLMENHPAFFSANAADFLAFNQDFDGFMKSHAKEAKILGEIGAKVTTDPLETSYWTPTPYALGATSMKYSARPCAKQATWQLRFQQMTGSSYLRENLAAHVARAKKLNELCMDFFIQVYKNERATPIDDATVAWDEQVSPPIHAAQLVFSPGQDIKSQKRIESCEALSFNGGHALKEHAPLGSLNLVRQIVYAKINEMRKTYNGEHGHPMTKVEPTSIEPGE